MEGQDIARNPGRLLNAISIHFYRVLILSLRAFLYFLIQSFDALQLEMGKAFKFEQVYAIFT